MRKVEAPSATSKMRTFPAVAPGQTGAMSVEQLFALEDAGRVGGHAFLRSDAFRGLYEDLVRGMWQAQTSQQIGHFSAFLLAEALRRFGDRLRREIGPESGFGVESADLEREIQNFLYAQLGFKARGLARARARQRYLETAAETFVGHASATGLQRIEGALSGAVLTAKAAGEYLDAAPGVLAYLVRRIYEKSVWTMRLQLLTF